MRDLNLALALVGGLTVALGLGAGLLRSRGSLPQETVLAVAVGVVTGPHGLALFDLSAADPPLALVERLARVTVAIAVASIGLRLPSTYIRRRARSLSVLLGVGMVATWLVSGLLTALLLPVSLSVGLLVGAIVTPTDPVVASTIVTGSTAEETVPRGSATSSRPRPAGTTASPTCSSSFPSSSSALAPRGRFAPGWR